MRLAALLHDVGKPKTRSFATGRRELPPPRGGRRAHGRGAAARAAYPNDLVDDVTQLVYLHLRIHTYAMGWTDKAVRRYVRDAGPLLDDLNHLQRCDCTTRNKRKAAALARRMDELEARIAELREQEELDAIRPPLDGRQVMELPRRRSRAASSARRSTSCSRLRLDEGHLYIDWHIFWVIGNNDLSNLLASGSQNRLTAL